MKKLLALLLAVMLVTALIPASTAATVAENGNTVYKYVFSAPAIGLEAGAAIKIPSDTDTTDTSASDAMVSKIDGGVIDYDDIVPEISDKWDLIALRSAHARQIHMNGLYFRTQAGNVTVSGANGVAIKINVPESGKYIPSIVFDGAKHGGIAAVYLEDTDDYTITTQFGIRDFINSGKFTPIGTVDTYASTGVNAEITGPEIPGTFSAIDLEKGDYYLVLTLIGGNDAIKTDGALPTTYMETKSFSLEKIAPASVEISATATKVEAGKTTTVSAKAYSADSVELPDEIVFSSSNPAVASVDAATGVVTANKFGNATITATVAGTEISDSVEIKVVDIYEYRFSYEALGYTAKSSFSTSKTYDDIKTDISEPWQYLSVRTGNGSLVRYGFYYAAKEGSGNHPLANNGLAFKIKVQEDGVYTPVTTYSLYRYGSKLNTYIITPELAESKGWNFTNGGTLKTTNEAVTPVSSVDSFDTSSSPIANENFASVKSVEGTSVSLAEGECYVVFAIDGNNANEGMTYTDHYMLIQSLKLVRTDDYTPPSKEKGAEIEEELSFAVLSNYEEAKAGVSADKVTVGNKESLAAGTKINAEAKDVAGFKFSHWKSGNRVLGEESKIEYTVVSNGSLVAVYEKESAESDGKVNVEFYNENGSLIEKKEVDKGTTFATASADIKPTLTGYTFDAWSIGGEYIINKLTRAVAMYERTNVADANDAGEGNAIDGNVTVTVDEITTTYENPNYNSEITAEAKNAFFSHWTRDGKIVSYDRTYTFRVWDATDVKAVYVPIAKAKVPTVVLDATAKGDAYMIEYDVPEGYTKVEAGIIFGTSTPDITGYYTKAASKSSSAHGQFTAERNPNEDAGMQATARGYLIYKDANGNYKVAYSD